MKNPIKNYRKIRIRYIAAFFIISALVCIFALRQNNQNMIKLRNAVYSADQKGVDVNGPLSALRDYVYAHMNTNLSAGANSVYPPIQLKYTYQRLQDASNQQTTQANSQVYTDAQHYCEQQNPVSFSGRTRVGCVEAYVEQHQEKNTPISPSLYEFDFISPVWSPDLAGYSLIVSLVSFVVLILTVLHRRYTKRISNFFQGLL
jgi:hypothetical protein